MIGGRRSVSVADGFEGDGDGSNLQMLAESQVFQSTELAVDASRRYTAGVSVAVVLFLTPVGLGSLSSEE